MACPFCNAAFFKEFNFPITLCNGKEFKYVSCNACGLKYLNPMPDLKDIAAMYEPSYHQHKIDTTLVKKIYQRRSGTNFNYGIQFDLINKYAGSEATILDFGCGDGNFIANAQHHGYICDGAEYNDDYLDLLRTGFPNTYIYHVDDFVADRTLTYDVIRMSNVLEHLIQPADTFKNLLSHLKPGGIFLIEGPLEDNISVSKSYRDAYLNIKRKFNPDFTFYSPPYHLVMSDAKNQGNFFRQLPEIKENEFIKDECAWPFPESFKDANGLKQKMLALYFAVAIFFARLIQRGKTGNEFLYVGKKIKES